MQLHATWRKETISGDFTFYKITLVLVGHSYSKD